MTDQKKEPITYNKYMNNYYHANKEKILRKVECPICQKLICKINMKAHEQSNKHIKNLAAMTDTQ